MLTVDRETANNDEPSLTGSYGVLLLHPWVFAGLVRECTPPDS